MCFLISTHALNSDFNSLNPSTHHHPTIDRTQISFVDRYRTVLINSPNTPDCRDAVLTQTVNRCCYRIRDSRPTNSTAHSTRNASVAVARRGVVHHTTTRHTISTLHPVV